MGELMAIRGRWWIVAEKGGVSRMLVTAWTTVILPNTGNQGY
ncbi:hypothetical protein Pan181_06450 [Aeoliella mucimassa]|uniref:Uncharacterized protein n=1 Tax=Aeoliella mucimassa TaxID=2527972 RepID=A0A518AIA6_9BACT|nr:hypothetical protein Pan181_06450 [Aeoliella mucimassa]